MIGKVGEGDPHLRPVEDVGITVLEIRRLDRPGIGTRVRLGQREGAELFPLRLRNEEALLLLLSGPMQMRETIEPDMNAHLHTEKGINVFELLTGDGEGNVVEPRAAVRLGNGKAEDAEFPHSSQDFRVKLALGVPL